MEITPLGDSALVVRVEENALARTLAHLRAAAIAGVQEYAPAYASIGVFFDPIRAVEAGAPPASVTAWLSERIASAVAASADRPIAGARTENVVIPVCYDAEFALDLAEVAHYAALPVEAVIQQHSGAEYSVRCIGFTPGFPYLAGLPGNLATPRRATPRKKVPAGSVAIGGSQTGIYPSDSPGGWNIIGRSPLKLFVAEREPPSLLRAGDRVQFRPITRAEFNALSG